MTSITARQLSLRHLPVLVRIPGVNLIKLFTVAIYECLF
jgi:hypothetical protein